ncbi:MAG: hypothetical protein GXP31_01780 [Kiritimatiellaeota bacterium]|nr:hypothetical protein [Kiritimatiellota bacterium]
MWNRASLCPSAFRQTVAGLMLPVLLVPAAGAQEEKVGGSAPWQQEYRGEEATGDRVVALWQFNAGAEAADASGHGHALKLRGQARFVPGGRFGGALESFPGSLKNDHAQGAETPSAPDLSPVGAFTIDMWLKPKPELAEQATAFLLDKKYYHYAKDLPKANRDYCLYLSRVSGGKRRLVAYLGYGTDSAQYNSVPFELPTGQWVHVAFTYNGKGVGRFFVDGRPSGRTSHPGRGAVSPGKYPLVIGDRVGSIHGGFPGMIDQVRICRGVVPYFTGGIEISAGAGRTAFRRMEKNAAVRIRILNDTGAPLDSVHVRLGFGGRDRAVRRARLDEDAEFALAAAVDTSARAGAYPLSVRVEATRRGRPLRKEAVIEVRVVNRRPPYRMPVVLWGGGDLEQLREIGFTHHLTHMEDYLRIWKAGGVTESVDPGRISEIAQRLDRSLAAGIDELVYLYPGHWATRRKEFERFLRVDKSGKVYPRKNLSAGLPEMLEFAWNVGASVGRTFGGFPALDGALINSEVRDGTAISYHPEEREACRKALGFDIPALAVSKNGVRYESIPGFPADRIIPDRYPLLRFYRWFWKNGDGWNPFHSQIHRGLKQTIDRSGFWTFFDPAVRAPSVWGSGGQVDVISQWTYSYPDPIKIGQAADELFAMAAGRPGQKVMKMTQIIWYRSQTAPKLPRDPAQRAQWEKDVPDAKFITISPDHLREAFWCEVSRPVAGIMYHGWGSLVKAQHGSYRYTNPETRGVLAELIHGVVRPLGPTLLQVPDPPADVALLESFTSQMFAGRGSYGWSGSWEADMHLILQWAGFQPRILYEETVDRDGLGGVRVLVMPNCDVLPATVAARVRQFQRNGGLVVADENLAPGITPDVLVRAFKRKGPPDKDKAELLAKAAALRDELEPFYRPYGHSSDPEAVIRFRRYKETDYLFVINDKRTYGDYVGHHRKVMEKGVPNRATVTVRRADGVVYDLLAHREVEARKLGDALAVTVALGPGGGRLFMITPRPIRAVVCRTGARRTARGGAQSIAVQVVDDRGKPVAAVVPVLLEIEDPAGRPAEFSGYYGAAGGAFRVKLNIAPNDRTGEWKVRATELASGRQVETRFTVTP